MHHVHGSGTINVFKDDLNKTFTKDLVERSIKIQKELLNKAIKILKSGGEIVYSTCSILKEENEQIIEDILKLPNIELIEIDHELFKNVSFLSTNIKGTILILPSKLYEGFFVAKLKKK